MLAYSRGARKVVQFGRAGTKVIVKRLVFNQEDIIKEEIISENIYSPEPKIIKYNQD
ncbi:G5 domain-containing protein [Halanaerobaculum tunisiense]